jgi:hypothetical protein
MIDYCEYCETEIDALRSCAVCGKGGLCETCAEQCELSHEEEVYN